jgi:hypothetical protein
MMKMLKKTISRILNKCTTTNTRYKQFGHLAYGKIGLYLEDFANPKDNADLAQTACSARTLADRLKNLRLK